MKPKIISEETIYDAKWLKLVRVEMQIRGKTRRWVYCTRREVGAAQTLADAVVVVPFLREGGSVKVVLVREFRVPLKGYQIAFPAGLIDAGETVRMTAERELAEETGCRMVNFIRQSPPLSASAGMTDETYQYAFVEAALDGAPKLEASEEMEVLRLTLSEVKALLQSNEKFCGRTWSLLDQFIQQNQFQL